MRWIGHGEPLLHAEQDCIVLDQLTHLGFSGQDVPPDDVFNQCVRCGLCLPTCPTYVETLVETSGPRGRIALIKAVSEGQLDLTSPGFMHQMSECLDCRACEAVCPSGVRYGELLEPARTQIVRATAGERAPAARFGRAVLIGQLFSHLGLMRFAAALTRFYQRSGLAAFARSSGILRALKLESLEALAPRMSAPFFVPRGQTFAAVGERKATAFFHAGCIMHVAFAEWNEASVRVLTRAGLDVVVPADQGCCGAITIHAGEMERGRALAKQYGQLFHEDPEWHPRAVAFSATVRDITELLDEIGIGPGLGPVNASVTYQDPCHLAHAQRITAAPRRLLAQIPGLELREMEESSLCCGSAGIYNITQPEMAGRLGRRKVDRVIDAAPDILATANPGCALQIANGLRTAGHAIEVLHVVQLLDRSYAAGAP
jgi:glycolate oxidase iron-sulfur subunit